jgi:hypothetical protein
LFRLSKYPLCCSLAWRFSLCQTTIRTYNVTGKEIYDLWMNRLKFYKEKEEKGEELTKAEAEDQNFIEQKLDDYASDYDPY